MLGQRNLGLLHHWRFIPALVRFATDPRRMIIPPEANQLTQRQRKSTQQLPRLPCQRRLQFIRKSTAFQQCSFCSHTIRSDFNSPIAARCSGYSTSNVCGDLSLLAALLCCCCIAMHRSSAPSRSKLLATCLTIVVVSSFVSIAYGRLLQQNMPADAVQYGQQQQQQHHQNNSTAHATGGSVTDMSKSVFDFWLQHGPDTQFGGFHATLDCQGNPIEPTSKTIIQQVWFSKTFNVMLTLCMAWDTE